MTHVHHAIPGRCCRSEPAADVLAKLRAAEPQPLKGEEPTSFAQRKAAWKSACDREELMVATEQTFKHLQTPDVEGLPPTGVTGIPGVMLLGGETDPARIAAAVLDRTPDLSPFDREALRKEATVPKKHRASSKTGRMIYEVRWAAAAAQWQISRGGVVLELASSLKPEAVRIAVLHAQEDAERGGLAQVVVFNKNGRHQSERTYPRSSDPKRRKG